MYIVDKTAQGVNENLEKLANTLAPYGLKINHTKTKALWLTGSGESEISLNSERIEIVQEFCYQDQIIDGSANMKKKIDFLFNFI